MRNVITVVIVSNAALVCVDVLVVQLLTYRCMRLWYGYLSMYICACGTVTYLYIYALVVRLFIYIFMRFLVVRRCIVCCVVKSVVTIYDSTQQTMFV